MKKLFILFLMTNFYNIHTAEYHNLYYNADRRLTHQQKLLSAMSTLIQDVFTGKNVSELSFSSVHDQHGQRLIISSGIFTTYTFTLPQSSPTLQAVVAQLSLYPPQNEAQHRLQEIIRLNRKGRETAFSTHHSDDW